MAAAGCGLKGNCFRSFSGRKPDGNCYRPFFVCFPDENGSAFVRFPDANRTENIIVRFRLQDTGAQDSQEMKENSHLEFRQQVTSAFLKTVSAFANGEGGKIVFVRAADYASGSER